MNVQENACRREGVHTLSNPELIGIILSSGTTNRSAVDLGRDIINQHAEGISFLSETVQFEELCETRGVGPAKACQITCGGGAWQEDFPDRKKRSLQNQMS
jgi:DNA repair protein RadC